MHRELMGLAIGDTRQVDHVNCMKLDNRRINLRVCTIAENQRNRGKNKNNKSGFKGVTYFKFAKLWKAQICINRETLFLGYFKNPEDAHRAYCEAAAKHHGEFAKT